MLARNESHGYLIVQDSYISFGKDDWVAYLVLIGDLWKVRCLAGRFSVALGKFDQVSANERTCSMLVAPDDGKGQKLMELYLGKKYWNAKAGKYKKYQDQHLTLEKGGNISRGVNNLFVMRGKKSKNIQFKKLYKTAEWITWWFDFNFLLGVRV